MTVLVTLTLAGADTGPFNLYSDSDGYTTPLATGVAKSALQAGYTLSGVPADATIIRTSSTGTCTNYIDMLIAGVTTTTTTTSSTSTTTTTTTSAPPVYDYYIANEYICNFPGCTLNATNINVAFPAGFSYVSDFYYSDLVHSGVVYQITSSTTEGISVILDTIGGNSVCNLACSV
jgi:hypothetical protein